MHVTVVPCAPRSGTLSKGCPAPSVSSRRLAVRRESAQRLRAQSEEKESTEMKRIRVKQSDLRTLQIPEGKTFEVLLMTLGFLARAGSGCFVDGYSASFSSASDEGQGTTIGPAKLKETNNKISSYKRPVKPIELYEYEACPFCRKVREAATILDLDVMYYPTPRGAPNHRAKVKELGGKELFPYMVDPNTGKSMYESDDIVAYLFNEYGDGEVPLSLRLGILTALSCGIVSLVRFGHGFSYRKAKYPEKPLVFWGYELSPFCKFVREALVELELPYQMINCGRGSAKRQQMVDNVGAFQVPYLEDPNTGVCMFESDDILKYIERTYALEAA